MIWCCLFRRASSRLSKSNLPDLEDQQETQLIDTLQALLPPIPDEEGDQFEEAAIRQYADLFRGSLENSTATKRKTDNLQPTAVFYGFDLQSEADRVVSLGQIEELQDGEESLAPFLELAKENSGISDLLLQFLLQVTRGGLFWGKQQKEKLSQVVVKVGEAISGFLLQTAVGLKVALLNERDSLTSADMDEDDETLTHPSLFTPPTDFDTHSKKRDLFVRVMQSYLCLAELHLDSLATNQKATLISLNRYLS